MAEPPLITLTDVALTFGGAPVFEAVTLAVASGERAALVGRNGSGKSTLMKLISGEIEPDRGARFVRPGLRIGRLEQEPDFGGFETLQAYVSEGLEEEELWRARMALDGVGLDGAEAPATASGGERRRAALARLLARDPDVMLLDEPTNHLDITAIAWLEAHLAQSRAAVICVSHDRAFLRAISRRILWLDRGELRSAERGFADFEAWRDTVFEEEDVARHKLDRRIRSEARWAVEGISARRKRNQGRLRRLESLRSDRIAQITRSGPAQMALEAAPVSGRLVSEARDVAVDVGGRTLFSGVNLRIQRGERIAIVGPNGVGKTTLLEVLTGQRSPSAGSVRVGTNLEPAVLDQTRAALDPEASLWDSLTGDDDLGVSGRNDQIMVRGRPRHVAGYLKDFLFTDLQFRGPVSALSGGERARLLLARLMARESNLLILDEPTNDLDVETLDLLQELIDDYEGTVLLVSHDRDFIDRVATTTVALEGDGRAVVYAGGWTDYRSQRKAGSVEEGSRSAQRSDKRDSGGGNDEQGASRQWSDRLGFKETHRLEQLPGEIERLSAEIAKIEGLLSDPDLYGRAPTKFYKATAALEERQVALEAAEEEWLDLEARREALERR